MKLDSLCWTPGVISAILFTMITYSPAQTMEYALKYAKKLQGGEILGLTGDLGSGKTTFAKGLAEGLNVSETITSPTFVILKSYPGKIIGKDKRITFVHVDAYRIETADDLKSVGIEDYLGRNDSIIIIEWAEKIKEQLPKNTIYLNFVYLEESARKISG